MPPYTRSSSLQTKPASRIAIRNVVLRNVSDIASSSRSFAAAGVSSGVAALDGRDCAAGVDRLARSGTLGSRLERLARSRPREPAARAPTASDHGGSRDNAV